jgi:seryl-tRNA synthetase
VRKLIEVMLFFHRSCGYQEYLFPLLNNRNTFFCSGHLSKFADQSFTVENSDFFLIPTAEVPLVSVFRDEILDKKQLPLKLCAYTPCFRREAGAAGKKTKGLLRMHQFHKVEIFQVVEPQLADVTLEEMLKHCEELLKIFEIPYQVVLLPP